MNHAALRHQSPSRRHGAFRAPAVGCRPRSRASHVGPLVAGRRAMISVSADQAVSPRGGSQRIGPQAPTWARTCDFNGDGHGHGGLRRHRACERTAARAAFFILHSKLDPTRRLFYLFAKFESGSCRSVFVHRTRAAWISPGPPLASRFRGCRAASAARYSGEPY
jgi:hypothetical protein